MARLHVKKCHRIYVGFLSTKISSLIHRRRHPETHYVEDEFMPIEDLFFQSQFLASASRVLYELKIFLLILFTREFHSNCRLKPHKFR